MTDEHPHTKLPPPASRSQIRFYRLDLVGLPELAAPEGYALRTYRPGDEEGWAAVLNAAFPDPNPWSVEKIRNEFLDRLPFRPERVFFAEHEGQIVGCAAAWETGEPGWGYVHWVAVHPEHQGKRLGRLVTLATLHRFLQEDTHKAFLDTDEHRIPAIRTYLGLGFHPDLRDPGHAAMWLRIERVLEGE